MGGFQFLEIGPAMKNSILVIFLSCLVAATLTAPRVTAAVHGGGFSGGHSFAGRPGMGMPGRSGMGMRSGFTPRSMGRMPMHRDPMLGSMGRMPMHRAPTLSSTGRMPMHRDPMMNSPSGLPRSGDRAFDRDDRFGF